MSVGKDRVRIAAVADIHCHKPLSEALRNLLSQMSAEADIMLLCGDLTDHGLTEEAQSLAKGLGTVKIPVLAVLGNHDYGAGKEHEIQDVLSEAGVLMMDGSAHEIHGIGFAGVKGFAGGFGRRTLEPWGERSVKVFVQEAIDETLKLESALARLQTETQIAIMHYAPIYATVQGEPPEIFAFLGSSRLEEPLNRYGVTTVFHGHAHHGTPEGHTQMGIPVYNVSMQLLRRTFPNKPPFRILEIPVEPPPEFVEE